MKIMPTGLFTKEAFREEVAAMHCAVARVMEINARFYLAHMGREPLNFFQRWLLRLERWDASRMAFDHAKMIAGRHRYGDDHVGLLSPYDLRVIGQLFRIFNYAPPAAYQKLITA